MSESDGGRWRWRLVALVAILAVVCFGAGFVVGRYTSSSRVSAGPADPLDTVSRLAAGIQVSTYTDLLGAPRVKRPISEGPMVEWIWHQPEFEVQAVVDNLGQVKMYTLTSLSSTFHPLIPLTEDSSGNRLRLGTSKFDQIPIEKINGSEGSYPANAMYHYSELFGGDGSHHSRYLILTKSWDGTGAPEPTYETVEMLNQAANDCDLYSGFKVCKDTIKLARVRAGMYISGFTITAPGFDPRSIVVNRSPFLPDSACDVPNGCR